MKIIYPTKLSEIPLLNYQKWMKTAQNSNDEELMAHKFVEIFLGVKLTDVRSMAVKDVNFFIEEVVNVLNTKPKFKKRWKYGKHEFGLITDFENMSWGEYIDIEANLTDVKNWHKAMAVLYRPIIETYKDTYKIMEYQGDDTFHEPMKYAPLDIVLGIQVFFWNIEKELLNNTMSCLKKQMKMMNENQNIVRVDNSQSSTDGIIASIESVRGMLHDLPKLHPYPYIKHSHSLPMKYKKIESNITIKKDN